MMSISEMSLPRYFSRKLTHKQYALATATQYNTVTLQLIRSKCIPALLYGLEACPMNKSDLRLLDFVVDRLFVKLFKTANIQIVRECQKNFGFELPSQCCRR